MMCARWNLTVRSEATTSAAIFHDSGAHPHPTGCGAIAIRSQD